ncbi:cytochrome b/b6 domain-containing protein [Caldimonas sp. KR1-144]|uniref:cytochrome b/b6 domain-containing protein n=1 Tax=Caldimonas sp. KR1-144 TaxID=3400911 RepID=UPI003BFFDAC0
MHPTTGSMIGSRAPDAPPSRGRRVVDAPMRMFHWLLALSFAGAWLSAESEHWRAMHVTLGYTMAGLLGWRIAYGLVGPRQARLSVLLGKLGGAREWLRSLRQDGTPRWRPLQNLVMAGAVVALLALVGPLALSGYAVYADWGGEWLEELHELFANALLAVVFAHLAAIVLLSLLRRRNQALPMLTGRVPEPGPDVVRANRRPLATALLAAVLAFGAWQWHEAPGGLLPAANDAATANRGHHDDRD